VCWVHNWPECPEWIEVVELSKEIAKIADHEIGRFYERGSQEKVFTHDWWRGIHAASSPKPHLFRGRVFSCVLDDAHLGSDDDPWFL
jgi:hypothetical protein